ncbi:MAG: putative glycolipid-binding domain-containing protein [Pseudonocardiaceae bacterium]
MSAPDRAGAGRSKPATSPTTMLTWAGVGASRLEAVRVVLGGRGMRATGSMVAAAVGDLPAFSASYTLATDEAGVMSRLSVRTIRASGEQHVALNRSEEGIWLVDHGSGAARTDFDGALDVDLAYSPLFNALPVRRLGLHRAESEHDLPIVFVALPTLEVELVRQTYRTVSLGEQPVVSFGSEAFHADLTVDTEGLVLDYPGLARRLPS